LSLQLGSTLLAELVTANPVNYDRVNVTGSVALAGSLDLSLLFGSGFAYNNGDYFLW
jgi:hypothetical protein